MVRILLLILFVILLTSRALGLDLSLGPGLSVKNALLYATAGLIAVQIALNRDREFELAPVIVPFVILIVYALMTWLVIVLLLEYPYYEPRETLIRLKTKLGDQLLMLLVFFYGVTRVRDAMWLLKALVWLAMSGSLVTVMDTFNIPDLGIITTRAKDGRVEGILGSAQEFGAFLAFFLPAMFVLWWNTKGVKRLLVLLGIGLTMVALLLSGSRGAVLGVIAGGAFASYLLRRSIPARFVVRGAIAVALLAVLATVVLLSANSGYDVSERMTRGFGMGEEGTITSGRTHIWGDAIADMLRQPITFITGFGWEAYYQTVAGRISTHSVYVDLLYNLGLIGVTLFLLPFISSMLIARGKVASSASDVRPFVISVVFGVATLIVSMAFSDVELAATYSWAYTALVLRAAIAAQSAGAEAHGPIGHPDPHGQTVLASQPRTRVVIREATNLATRPTSATPRR